MKEKVKVLTDSLTEEVSPEDKQSQQVEGSYNPVERE